jgi:hypothetical protein
MLHCLQIGDRADGYRDPEDLRLAAARAQFFEARDSLEALDDIKAAEIGLDRDLFTAGQR